MQQTSLDRWLRKKYVYHTHVYCNTLPHKIPYGIVVEETTEEMGSRYLYRLDVPTEELLNELTAHLEVANITYTSRVGATQGVSDKVFNNPDKSFTMQIAWIVVVVAFLGVIFSGLPIKLWKELSVKEESAEKDFFEKLNDKILDYLSQ